jgi:microcystin-dependent protein
MATVTPGYTFTNNEVVTPAKLNSAATPTVAVVDGEVTESKIATNAVTSAKIATDAVTSAKIANGAVTQDKLNSSVTLVPTGAVMPFAMNAAPSGWLAANGSAVSRTTYAALFAAIGTTYGAGDGNSTFTLPDLRGYFVRGSGTNVDGTASGTFGAKQTDGVGSHNHTYNYASATYQTITGENSWPGTRPDHTLVNGVYPLSGGSASTSSQSPAGTTETRPRNIAMLYCIKA